MADSHIEPIPSPDGVEVVTRGTGDRRIRMLINHNAHEVKAGGVVLEPFGCVIQPAD